MEQIAALLSAEERDRAGGGAAPVLSCADRPKLLQGDNRDKCARGAPGFDAGPRRQ